MPILSRIYVYPVKSLAGFAVERWPVGKTGLRFDRKWMLVDEQGKFLSQRRLPRMCLIKTRLAGNRLILSAPGHADIELAADVETGADLNVEIWKDRCVAKTTTPEADRWLSGVLDFPCRLVFHPDHRVRKVDLDYASADDETAFSDGFPFLIISEASLEALNAAMSLDLPMIRFRPNLVVADCQSYAEDYWRSIVIGEIRFRLPKPCARCPVPTIDLETASYGKEPLTTLARIRQWQNKVYFGQNALHDSVGSLAVGDLVDVRQTGDRQPPLAD